MENFAMIGAAGFIAPRHMKAIKETGNQLVVACDRNDSVGIIDSYFPEADFFTEFERFDRHVEKLRREDKDRAISYVSICSPNYLHDAHIRFALRVGAHAICEKPLVLNPWNIDALTEVEKEFDRKVSTILQLRLHPAIMELRKKVENGPSNKTWDVDLIYITSRGKWYNHSWKGDNSKSGGVATNIGIHFFDMLTWIFGPAKVNKVNVIEPTRAAGYLELGKARVRWFLSCAAKDLPKDVAAAGKRTFRTISVGGEELEFSEGFTDLHTESYKHILAGRGFGMKEARASIEIAHDIRNATPVGLSGDYHPILKNIIRD